MNSDIIDAIEFDEKQVDIESIMRQIRQYLAQKQETQAASRIEEPTFVMLDREVYDELYEANQYFDKIRVAPYLTPVRIPLFGVLWQRLRLALHALVVFYIDRSVDTQMRFNTHVVRVLNGIVRGVDTDLTLNRVAELERRMEALEKQIHALGARTDTTAPEAREGS